MPSLTLDWSQFCTGFSTNRWKTLIRAKLSLGGEPLSWTARGRQLDVRNLCCFGLLCCALLHAQSAEGEKIAPYYPTPETIVEKMLQLGGLKAGERMFDLGSGDGRIVIMAAQKFHADATGIEMDKDLYRQSMDKIQSLRLQKTARIINGDIVKQ